MNAIEVYKQGYGEGAKERNSGLIENFASGLAGMASHEHTWSGDLKEAYAKGYQDGLKGNEFDPPSD